jgi:hypothetical protein
MNLLEVFHWGGNHAGGHRHFAQVLNKSQIVPGILQVCLLLQIEATVQHDALFWQYRWTPNQHFDQGSGTGSASAVKVLSC